MQQYNQINTQTIFININIITVNLTQDKIDELNKSFKILDKNLTHKLIDQTETAKMIIQMTALLEMLIEDTESTKNSIDEYRNPYKMALESCLFFLEYINERVVKENQLDTKIYDEFYLFLTNKINNIIFNKEKFFFNLYVYEWLKKEKYISSNYPIRYGEKNSVVDFDDLKKFYEKNHRTLIDWIINNKDNLEQNPLDDGKNRVFFELLNKLQQIR